ncbi:hypothetical protein SAMN05216390_1422 [Lachnospiraceae bacterium KH1T2]|nr:hypothetical protein SAMN05216390_1422 [Lachnospiraceae bacterium KH1T2]
MDVLVKTERLLISEMTMDMALGKYFLRTSSGEVWI